MRRLKKELWPCKISVPGELDPYDVEIWLGENCGSIKNRWNVVYNFSTVDYYFRDNQDMLMFALRWG